MKVVEIQMIFSHRKKTRPKKYAKTAQSQLYPLPLPAHKMPGEGPTAAVPVPVLLPTLRLASRKLLVIEVGLDIWLIVDHQDDDMVPSHF